MTLIAFVAVCVAACCLGLMARPSDLLARLAGVAGLATAFAIALFIRDGQSVDVGDVHLAAGTYSGLFLTCVTGSALLLFVAGLGTTWPERLAPAALGAFGCLAVALTASSPAVALIAAAMAVTTGSLAMQRATSADDAAALSGVTTVQTDGRLAEARTMALVVGALLLAAIAVLRPAWNSSSSAPIFVLGIAGLGLALAVRSGAVPFHAPAVRLRKTAVPMAPALLLVWLPAGIGILAVSWSATTFKIHGGSMDAAVAVLQLIAVATLLLGAIGALLREELDEIAAYSILADAGFVLLALAARSDAAAEPARLWLLVFVAAKTGLVVWAAALAHAYGSSRLDELHGWVRRTPLLALALAAIALATLGWPGSPVYEARASLIRLALPGQLGLLGVAATLMSLAYVGRLLGAGVLSASDTVRAGSSEWPLRPHRARPADAAESPAVVAAAAVTAAEPDPAEAAPPVSAEEPPKRKRRSRAAAAAEPLPVLSAPVDAAPATAPAEPPAEPEATAGATHNDLVSRLAAAWRLNRTLEVSLVVVGAAVMAAALAVGALGASGAARSGVPMDIPAHATATPTPPPTLAPIPTEGPTPSESPTPEVSGSPGSSASVRPSASPTPGPTQTPVKTLAPKPPNQ